MRESFWSERERERRNERGEKTLSLTGRLHDATVPPVILHQPFLLRVHGRGDRAEPEASEGRGLQGMHQADAQAAAPHPRQDAEVEAEEGRGVGDARHEAHELFFPFFFLLCC